MSPENRKQALIDAALELFGSAAPERVTMEDVAAHAQVSRALVYRYFSNIEEIHVAALRTSVDDLVARIRRERDGDLLTQLQDTIGEFVAFAEDHAAGYIALLRGGSVIATSETAAMVDEARHAAVDEVLVRLEIADPSPFLLLTLRCWVAACEGALLTWLQERTLAREELVPWLSGQLVAMIAATAGHDPAIAAFIAKLESLA
ncbi:TetR/AcrR family transcriptional regulator [Actinocorallia sp. A-T 12471]|uniref:TetR/AcrR family transcriptional regulator n=1 Tax=Actinocorallia sp. A-T 12471 TaxID=3089813 RepID=UPI0029CD12C4|nr:TetR/AcrR family transcriptional regulator [Actinocorallia sp. A-T 12471]MDX6741243.1 TetR/AcrR family transcriptional regulator [Actinocorallia sp. A-T 12471]